METYQDQIMAELKHWQNIMMRKPSLASKLSKGLQTKFNNLIPEKVHNAITFAIANMTKAVLVGSVYTTKKSIVYQGFLEEREKQVKEKLVFYRKTAATTGAGTGAGGIFLGLADFPILLGLKIKFLFDVASIYGFDVKDYRERVYILTLFQLAFSSVNGHLKIPIFGHENPAHLAMQIGTHISIISGYPPSGHANQAPNTSSNCATTSDNHNMFFGESPRNFFS